LRNQVVLKRIGPHGECLAAEVETPGGAEVLLARKIVLATGMEGAGRWYTPPLLHELPKPYWEHASEAIDFAALRGEHVAVLGAAATARIDAIAQAITRRRGK
jgi:cation diffusion facilitator CzcD-associated flavoprotein CzcO